MGGGGGGGGDGTPTPNRPDRPITRTNNRQGMEEEVPREAKAAASAGNKGRSRRTSSSRESLARELAKTKVELAVAMEEMAGAPALRRERQPPAPPQRPSQPQKPPPGEVKGKGSLTERISRMFLDRGGGAKVKDFGGGGHRSGSASTQFRARSAR